MNYKEKLLNLPNRTSVMSSYGFLQSLHSTVKLLNEYNKNDFEMLKSLYLQYDNLKSRGKKRK